MASDHKRSMRIVRDELLPGLASPFWGLDESATIWVDAARDCLCVGDKDGVAFMITRAEFEGGSYKRKFNPQMQAWREVRAARALVVERGSVPGTDESTNKGTQEGS